ncbi:SubName: Full=Uncharacterized protein {ECO:0000313/EMBL:CCA71542.1} [Serendipita indica DSM 11827]|nr:SubName: Full=Uncharacterized protein {ECO:0000313/EMBL:CCA71542.1} [Serendipita indica DSM 11827]
MPPERVGRNRTGNKRTALLDEGIRALCVDMSVHYYDLLIPAQREQLPPEPPSSWFNQRAILHSPLPLNHSPNSVSVPTTPKARRKHAQNSVPVLDPAFSNDAQQAREDYAVPSKQLTKKRRSTISTSAPQTRPHVEPTSPLSSGRTDVPLKSSLKSSNTHYKVHDALLGSPLQASPSYFRSPNAEFRQDAQRPSPKTFFREEMVKEHDKVRNMPDSKRKEGHYSSHSRVGRSQVVSQWGETMAKTSDSPQPPPTILQGSQNYPDSKDRPSSANDWRSRQATDGPGNHLTGFKRSPMDPWNRLFQSPQFREGEYALKPSPNTAIYPDAVIDNKIEASDYNSSRPMRSRPRSYSTHVTGRNPETTQGASKDDPPMVVHKEIPSGTLIGEIAGEQRESPISGRVDYHKGNDVKPSLRRIPTRKPERKSKHHGTEQAPQVSVSNPTLEEDEQFDDRGQPGVHYLRQYMPSTHTNLHRSASPPNVHIEEGPAERSEFFSPRRTRNDNSMTYVAVTASGSSPLSDADRPGELSEASNYEDDGPSGTLDEWSLRDQQVADAMERRNALLTGLGLGLGLTHLPTGAGHDPQIIESTRFSQGTPSMEQKTPSNRASPVIPRNLTEQRHQSCVHLDQYDVRGTAEDTWRPSRHQSPSTAEIDSSKREDGLRQNNPNLGSIKPKKSRAPDSQVLAQNLEGDAGDPVVSQPRRNSFRNDARRNTWVYDANQDKSSVTSTLKEVNKTKSDRMGSISTVWSDTDSMDEPLSENARRMLLHLDEAGAGHPSRVRSHRIQEPVVQTRQAEPSTSPVDDISGAPETVHPLRDTGIKTWRNTISSSAYQALHERYGPLEMKRQDVIFELCETEGEFLKSLKIVQRLFIEPLSVRGNWVEELPIPVRRAFEAILRISDLHNQISSTLNSIRSSQYPLMLQFAESFRPFVARLEQIWELTPRDHVDNLPIFSLYQSMDMTIRVMQEVKIREEEYKYIISLANRITGLPPGFNLAHPERRLIAQGLLRRILLTDKERQRLGEHRVNNTPLHSPLETTPTITDLTKLGPVTSPLFPSHHNRTPVSLGPPSPYSPRQSFMSAISRASSAVSDASHLSEWTASYSPTSSVALPAEFDPVGRPPSSASSISSFGNTPFAPYGERSPLMPSRGLMNSMKTSRSRSARETTLYAFIFEDLLVFTSQTEKHSLFASSASQVSEERMGLIEGIGLSRILGVTDQSKKLDYEHLLQIDIVPILSGDGTGAPEILTPNSIFLSLPVIPGSHLESQSALQVKEAQGKWMTAFNRSYSHTLRALSFSGFPPIENEDEVNSNTRTIHSTLLSGDLLFKRPFQTFSEEENESPTKWTRKFRRALDEFQGTQTPPVMLIGEVALTMGKGLKRVHTTSRVKRSGPQQLLLSTASLLSSPSGGSSGSNQSQGNSLGLRRRERV